MPPAATRSNATTGRGRKPLLIPLATSIAVFGAAAACAENPVARGTGALALFDSTGKIAASPFGDALVLVTDRASDVVAPASIQPIYGEDSKTASGVATWRSGGSVLYTSADCTSGAYVFTTGNAGLRATTQVQTPDGIVLHVGAIGTPTSAAIRSIRYDSGCSQVTIRQNGLVPVDAIINLTTTYPPPLSFR